MADLDGRDLYREIVRRWPQWAERCVFVTGDSLAPGLREFMRESRRPVIDKPFLPAEVRRVIAEVMACRKAARDTFPPTRKVRRREICISAECASHRAPLEGRYLGVDQRRPPSGRSGRRRDRSPDAAQRDPGTRRRDGRPRIRVVTR